YGYAARSRCRTQARSTTVVAQTRRCSRSRRRKHWPVEKPDRSRINHRLDMKHSFLSLFVLIFLLVLSAFFPGRANANAYLPKPEEAPIKVRLGTCSLTGAF